MSEVGTGGGGRAELEKCSLTHIIDIGNFFFSIIMIMVLDLIIIVLMVILTRIHIYFLARFSYV